MAILIDFPQERQGKSRLATSLFARSTSFSISDISPDARISDALLNAIITKNDAEINKLIRTHGPVYINRLIKKEPLRSNIFSKLKDEGQMSEFNESVKKFFEILNDKLADVGPSA